MSLKTAGVSGDDGDVSLARVVRRTTGRRRRPPVDPARVIAAARDWRVEYKADSVDTVWGAGVGNGGGGGVYYHTAASRFPRRVCMTSFLRCSL